MNALCTHFPIRLRFLWFPHFCYFVLKNQPELTLKLGILWYDLSDFKTKPHNNSLRRYAHCNVYPKMSVELRKSYRVFVCVWQWLMLLLRTYITLFTRMALKVKNDQTIIFCLWIENTSIICWSFHFQQICVISTIFHIW